MLKILNKINVLRKSPSAQRGAVLMVMLVILVVAAATMLLKSLNSATPQLARAKITAEALAQAKEALIGYATSVDLSGSKRPGDLPCPDNHPFGDINEGSPTTPCNSNAIGRLPWKKLGLPDLRDSSGERLWYAVSTNFKDTPRTGILNSDTPGTISVFSPDGALIHDGGGSTGAVAVIIAPGAVLTRQGASSPQDRSSTGYLTAANYLDTPSAVADPKDNASFIDASSTDGFIQGKIQIYDPATKISNVILNDQLLAITQDNMMQAIQKRVAKEVVIALNKYYCGDTNVNPAGGCVPLTTGNHFYPRPADFTDNSCLGNGDLTSNCTSNNFINKGRIPATPATAWSISSILRGTNTSNWFRDNAWREVMFYAVAGACTDGTTNCSGTGYLTLNNPPASPSASKKVLVIATGGALAGQSRSGIGPPNTISNYLEDENLAPLDDVYTKSAGLPFNDIATSIP